jgi:hypothetical protein
VEGLDKVERRGSYVLLRGRHGIAQPCSLVGGVGRRRAHAAVAGLGVGAARAGAFVTELDASAIALLGFGAVALIACAWWLGGANARLFERDRWWLAPAVGAIGAVECLLAASLALFLALLTSLALGAGGGWGDLIAWTGLVGKRTPTAALIAAGLGAVWGLGLAAAHLRPVAARRRAS